MGFETASECELVRLPLGERAFEIAGMRDDGFAEGDGICSSFRRAGRGVRTRNESGIADKRDTTTDHARHAQIEDGLEKRLLRRLPKLEELRTEHPARCCAVTTSGQRWPGGMEYLWSRLSCPVISRGSSVSEKFQYQTQFSRRSPGCVSPFAPGIR